MRFLVSMSVAVCLLAVTPNATNAESAEVLEVPSGEVIRLFEEARRCGLLGEPFQDKYGNLVDSNWALCRHGADGNVAFYAGGVQFGIIERLEAVGLPVKLWRQRLADPVQLARFQKEWEEPLHLLLLSVLESNGHMPTFRDEEGQLYSHTVRHLRAFLLRRVSEAEPAHRQDVARIWGEIIERQLVLYQEAEPLLPDFLR